MQGKDSDEKRAEDARLVFPEEKRAYPRVALSVPVFYKTVSSQGADEREYGALIKKGSEAAEKKESTETQTKNISSGGLLMTTTEKLPCGGIIYLSMYMPLPGLACSCSVLGEVVRSEERKESGKYDTAVKFVSVNHHNMNKYTYAALKELLNIDGSEMKF
ncbi:MAG: PilZ domain-containing protein [Candidatus Goldiibacteriota bacterium]